MLDMPEAAGAELREALGSGFPKHPLHKIACIGALVASRQAEGRPYFHRYTEDALDLCDVLGSYVPGAKVKLSDVSKILGLSGKPEGIDGSRVEEMVLSGQIEEVSRYCESDVVNPYRVWLVYELFRGATTTEQLQWSEKQLRDFVQARRAVNEYLNAALGVPTCDTS
jgi:predicted PolB exonuclease-like 3'-5' exonuclease